jgi:hypothetical protein
MAPSSLKGILPGVPIVESTLFPALVEELDWTDKEKRIGFNLHELGYAVVDFPDDELDARIERIKASLTPRFGSQSEDPAAVKNTGEDQRLEGWIRSSTSQFTADMKAGVIGEARPA